MTPATRQKAGRLLSAAAPVGAKDGPVTSTAVLIVVSGRAIEARLAHDCSGAAFIGAGAKAVASRSAVIEAEDETSFHGALFLAGWVVRRSRLVTFTPGVCRGPLTC